MSFPGITFLRPEASSKMLPIIYRGILFGLTVRILAFAVTVLFSGRPLRIPCTRCIPYHWAVSGSCPSCPHSWGTPACTFRRRCTFPYRRLPWAGKNSSEILRSAYSRGREHRGTAARTEHICEFCYSFSSFLPRNSICLLDKLEVIDFLNPIQALSVLFRFWCLHQFSFRW